MLTFEHLFVDSTIRNRHTSFIYMAHSKSNSRGTIKIFIAWHIVVIIVRSLKGNSRGRAKQTCLYFPFFPSFKTSQVNRPIMTHHLPCPHTHIAGTNIIHNSCAWGWREGTQMVPI